MASESSAELDLSMQQLILDQQRLESCTAIGVPIDPQPLIFVFFGLVATVFDLAKTFPFGAIFFFPVLERALIWSPAMRQYRILRSVVDIYELVYLECIDIDQPHLAVTRTCERRKVSVRKSNAILCQHSGDIVLDLGDAVGIVKTTEIPNDAFRAVKRRKFPVKSRQDTLLGTYLLRVLDIAG